MQRHILAPFPLFLLVICACTLSATASPVPPLTPKVLSQVLLNPTDGSLNPDLWSPLESPPLEDFSDLAEASGKQYASVLWESPSGILLILLVEHPDPREAEASLQASGRAYTKNGFQQRFHPRVEGLPEHSWLATKFEEDLACFIFISQDREYTLHMGLWLDPLVLTDKERSQLFNEDAPQVHYVFELAKEQWARINDSLP